MKNYKQLIAGAMAAIMVLGSSVVALADEGSTTGQGSLDIAKESDIFDVKLPVVPTSGSPFDYILDPTGVISQTNSEKYGGKDFEEGATLFFYVSDGDEYKHESEVLTAINKSTMDVEIKVTASVAQVSGITIGESIADVSGGDAALYLGFVDDESTTAITVAGINVTATIDGAEDQYEVKYDSVTDSYKKQLKANATGFDTYNFHLEGACSADGWENLATVTPPAVEVVWTIERPADGPKVTLSSTGLITITGLTAEQDYASFLLNGATSSSDTKWDTSKYEKGKGGTITIQLGTTWTNWLTGKEVTVTIGLTDGSSISATATFD